MIIRKTVKYKDAGNVGFYIEVDTLYIFWFIPIFVTENLYEQETK